MARPRMVHFWGQIHDRRVIAPCVLPGTPPEEWRVTGIVTKVTCKHCIKILKQEMLH